MAEFSKRQKSFIWICGLLMAFFIVDTARADYQRVTASAIYIGTVKTANNVLAGYNGQTTTSVTVHVPATATRGEAITAVLNAAQGLEDSYQRSLQSCLVVDANAPASGYLSGSIQTHYSCTVLGNDGTSYPDQPTPAAISATMISSSDDCPNGGIVTNGVCGEPAPSCSDFEGQEAGIAFPEGTNWQYPNQELVCEPVTSELNCYATMPKDTSAVCVLGNCHYGFGTITASECTTPEGVDVPLPDDGCVTGADGKTVCVNPDGSVTTTQPDGSSTTSNPDGTAAICGEKNGTVTCVSVDENGVNCSYANGETVCIASNGNEIEPSSPDHPNNGGNGDGDNSNDPLDPNSADTVTASNTDTMGDRKIVDALQQQTQSLIDTDVQLQQENQEFLSETFTQELPDSENQGTASENIASINQSTLDIEATIDDEITSLDDATQGNGFLSGQTSGMQNSANDVSGLFLLSGACSDWTVPFPNMSYTLKCDDFSLIRNGMEIFFGGMLLIYGFMVMTGSIREVK